MNLSLAQAIRQAYERKRTGVLVSEGPKAKRRLCSRSGFIVAARSSLKEERLGELLIRKGRIAEQHFRDASVFIKSGWRMGEILGELGVLGKEEIDAFVELQLTDIACSMLGEIDSRFGFSELTEVEEVLAKPLTAAAVLMEAARRTPHMDHHLQALLEESRPLEISPNPLMRFQDLSLGSEEGFLLSRIQGGEPPRAIFALSPLSEEDTARTLLGLLLTGIVEVRDAKEAGVTDAGQDTSQPRTSEQVGLELASGEVPNGVATREEIERCYDELHTQDHWQVLELSKGASSEEVKAAFHKKVRRYHPDRYRDITTPDFEDKLSYIVHRLQEAFDTLSKGVSAACYRALAANERSTTNRPLDGVLCRRNTSPTTKHRRDLLAMHRKKPTPFSPGRKGLLRKVSIGTPKRKR